MTSDGSLIVFDCSTGKENPSRGVIHTNQGNHLGALLVDPKQVAAGTGSQWKWQASPWGAWGLEPAAPIILGNELITTDSGFCRGYNVSEMQIPAEDKDGRYGGNDTALQYGGSIAVAIGMDVVYGFHGEFWRVRCAFFGRNLRSRIPMEFLSGGHVLTGSHCKSRPNTEGQ
jgi:hypothetical protein